MMRVLKSAHSGVIVAWALVVVGIATTLLGAIGANYIQGAKLAVIYCDKTAARFKAQRALDEAKILLRQAIEKTLDEVKKNPNVGFGKTAIRDMLGRKLRDELGFTARGGGLFAKKMDVDGNGLDEDDPEVTIRVNDDLTFEMASTAGSGGASASFDERVRFSWDGSPVDWEDIWEIMAKAPSYSHPIFNYVYFANNYGHLEAKNLVVNGDVRANDKFTIDGATINGYVTAYSVTKSSTAINLSQSVTGQMPRMWPEQAYIENVNTEYGSTLTVVRPTDPYKASDGKKIPWFGGYQPVVGTGGGGTSSSETQNEAVKKFYNNAVTAYNKRYQEWQKAQNKNKLSKIEAFKEDMKKLYTETKYSYKNTNKTIQSLINKTWNKSKCTIYVDEDDHNDNFTTVKNNKGNKSVTFDWSAYKSALDAWYELYKTYDPTSGSSTGNVSAYIPLLNASCLDNGIQRSATCVTNELAELPNLSDDEKYRTFCMSNVVSVTNIYSAWSVNNQMGGSLICENKYLESDTSPKRISFTQTDNEAYLKNSQWKEDSNYTHTLTRMVVSVSISGGYDGGVQPFEDELRYSYAQYDPYSWSRTKTTTCVKAMDAEAKKIERGSVILIGSEAYPIRINGPVYVDGDVLIRGFVSGQGTIYAGRNIHILGDITYMNPPSWPNAQDSSEPPATTNVVAENARDNAQRDMLMLAARGNIVVGDYTEAASGWGDTTYWNKIVSDWVSASWSADGSTDSRSYFDVNDSEIGYPSTLSAFTRAKYMQQQTSQKDMITLSYSTSGGELWKQSGYYGSSTSYYPIRPVKAQTLCYYQSKLGDKVISAMAQKDDSSSAWSWSSWAIWKYIWKSSPWRRKHAHGPGSWKSSNWWWSWFSGSAEDASEITHIDAILFANHGIFGKVGGTTGKKFTLNGSLICRDEGLLYGFRKRISDASIWLNYDMRIRSDSAEGNSLVAVTPDTTTTNVVLYVNGTPLSESSREAGKLVSDRWFGR